MLGPFYVGQVVSAPITITVDRDSELVDLTQYASIGVRITNPLGQAVSTSGAGIEIGGPGTIIFVWPLVSLFIVAGDYRIQVELNDAEGRTDLSDIGTFEVRRALTKAS